MPGPKQTNDYLLLDPKEPQSLALLQLLDSSCEGSLLVDKDCRIRWISNKYRQLLGLAEEFDPRGLEAEALIPNSLMRQVIDTGQPQLLDLMRFRQHWLVVTRLPLRDQHGNVSGALGLVFFDKLAQLRPVVDKYSRLQLPSVQTDDTPSQTRYSFADLIGSSPAMLALRQQALRVAPLDSTVLLLGETGTGKELVAQAIHQASARADSPFVSINTAALPESLIEAELFGAEPGAYTGADPKGRIGKFEQAQGGTLFLDEIGEMSTMAQSKLLRALQERQIERLGGNRVIDVDVRVIAATSRDLDKLVAEGTFRSDLYYRLNVLPLELPPLRERTEDIPQLLQAIGQDLAEQLGMAPLQLHDWLHQALAAYHWPGNIRELRNVIERLLLFSEQGEVSPTLLSNFLPGSNQQFVNNNDVTSKTDDIRPLAQQLAQAERNAIQHALERCGNNRSQAARDLGISRANLYEKIHKHKL